jgi:hypothetical protein
VARHRNRANKPSLWVLSVVNSVSKAATISLFPYLMLGSLEDGTSPWYLVLLVVTAPVSLLVATGVTRRLLKERTIRLRAQRKHQESRDDLEYVLYLRSFRVDDALSEQDPVGGRHSLTSLASNFRVRDPGRLDDTWEGRLIHLFERFGSVVAVGRPGESLPPLGASRFSVSTTEDGWKDAVSEAIKHARLVVIAAVAGRTTGEGTLWEYTEAVRLLPPSRVVLVALGNRDTYEHFRAQAVDAFAKRGATPAPALPDWPEPAQPHLLRNGFPLHGVVQFTDGWDAQFVHFDTTADPGLTPHGRWRGTMRTSIEPWLEECERGLPGDIVHPLRVGWHWQSTLLFIAGMCWFWVLAAERWADLAGWQKFAAFLALAFGAVSFWRLNDITRGSARDVVAVRFPAGTSPESPPETPGKKHYVVTQYVEHWPGPYGLGISVLRWYHDEDLKPTEPPFPASLRTPIIGMSLTRASSHRVVGGFALRAKAVGIVQTDRDVDRTSRQFAERSLLHGVNAFGATLASVISFVWSWSDSRMLTLIPFCLPVAFWSAGRSRYNHRRMNQRRLRPRVPEDLAREPSVLYLRPHFPDPVPQSLWEGSLDRDLVAIFSDPLLFRVGHLPDAPPPDGLARLPLPDGDWRTALTAALPHCAWVVIPATGTSPDTVWQVTEAMRVVPPSRLLLLLPPPGKEYGRFRKAVGCRLPDLPVPRGQWNAALRGVIHFADDWTPTVLRFSAGYSGDPRKKQLQRIRTELEPILDREPSHERSEAEPAEKTL